MGAIFPPSLSFFVVEKFLGKLFLFKTCLFKNATFKTDTIIFGKFKGKIKTLSTHDLLC